MVEEIDDASFGTTSSDAADSVNERLAVVAGRLNAAHQELVDLGRYVSKDRRQRSRTEWRFVNRRPACH